MISIQPLRVMALWVSVFCPVLLISCASAQDAPPQNISITELQTFRFGLTQRGQKPESWQLDLRDGAGVAQTAKLSNRLYGTGQGVLHAPLIIKTNYATAKTFGVGVASVSKNGAQLEVKLNGKLATRKSWKPADTTHDVNTSFSLDLPAGKNEISLQVTDVKGVVVMDALYIAANAAQLPGKIEIIGGTPAVAPVAANAQSGVVNGYRGLWFELGQKSKYGDKYSGGLGTYTANHVPLAVYAPAVDKTFFTYGGTKGADQRHLLIMVSYYDHKTNRVPRPVIVMDKEGVDDPHDNAVLNIDEQGHIWVFVSGRGKRRLGAKFRSRKPYDITAFERVSTEEMTYPQPHLVAGKGFLHLFTKYTGSGGKGRQLYFETSADGKTWSETSPLSLMEGHYQVSSALGNKIGTFFNVHPGANVDKRTNVYYAQTTDWGQTWTTVDGKPLAIPLTEPNNPALVVDYQKQNRLMYTDDLNWDKNGNPLLLYVTGKGAAPGPDGGPRELVLTRWTGTAWETHKVAAVDHNYDTGSLWVDGDTWTVIAPTGIGPQKWQGGGEMEMWTSRDNGQTWTRTRQITRNSAMNHNYARRPLRAKDPFFAFWADGDPTKFSKSQLYFSDSNGQHFQLPYDMAGEFATPLEIQSAAPKP